MSRNLSLTSGTDGVWTFKNSLSEKSETQKKETINKMKRQSMDWEKILANDTINNELISKIQTAHTIQ